MSQIPKPSEFFPGHYKEISTGKKYYAGRLIWCPRTNEWHVYYRHHVLMGKKYVCPLPVFLSTFKMVKPDKYHYWTASRLHDFYNGAD